MIEFFCAGCGAPEIHINGECATLGEMKQVQIIVRIHDPDDVNDHWEAGITYFYPEMFFYPEYREAVFTQAGRLFGDKLEEMAGEIDFDDLRVSRQGVEPRSSA